jgi:hypothetical protein
MHKDFDIIGRLVGMVDYEEMITGGKSRKSEKYRRQLDERLEMLRI